MNIQTMADPEVALESKVSEQIPPRKPDVGSSTAVSKKSGGRIVELDALRGLAALAVVFYHYTVHYYEIYGKVQGVHLPEFPLGFYGVHLFFIISGFVICMTLDKTKKPMDFVVSRFSRLFPVYWFCLLLTFSMVAFFGLPGREVSWQAALVNLTMIHRWFGVKDVDGVYWTLLVELSFYALMYLVFLTKRMRFIEGIAAGWLCFVIAIHYFQKAAGFAFSENVQMLLLLKFAPLFGSGIFFYKLKSEGNAWHRHLGIAFCFAAQILIRDRLLTVLIVAGLFAVFYAFVYGKTKFLSYSGLAFLGTISYSFYLIHQNIGYIVIREMLSRQASSFWLLAAPLGISLALASLVTFFIEKPSLKWIRSAYAPHQKI